MDFFVIHLPEQEERLVRLEKHINDVEVTTPIELNIIHGIRKKRGALGCALSHQKLIRYGSYNEYDYIIVVEDDVKFSKHFDNRFINCLKDIPNDWDVLVGGVSWVDIVKERVGENLVKIGDFCGTHFIVYRRTCYNRILEWNEGINKNIDRYIGSLSKSGELNVYCITPFIATQFDGYSTIRDIETHDGESFFKAQEKVCGS